MSAGLISRPDHQRSRTESHTHRDSHTGASDGYTAYSFRDSTEIDTTKQAKYVKRDFNHQEQVIVGSSIMAFIAILLVAMNNYNPKR